MIDWFSNETQIFSNPKVSDLELPNRWEKFSEFPGHIWLTSSGTRSIFTKWVAISKQAFLISAEAVNRHIHATGRDRFGCALPTFHTGGLAIYARAALTGSVVVPFTSKWDPLLYTDFLYQQDITLTSLVPTQVADLIAGKCVPPNKLKVVFVGGSELHPALYKAANDLGWPLFLTYGFTECASQVATTQKGGSSLKILSHIEAKIDSDKRLLVKSRSLLTGCLFKEQGVWRWSDPKVDGWYKTEDLVELKDNTLIYLGRTDDYIKILGEFVSLIKLERLFQQLTHFTSKACIVVLPDLRLGHRLVAVGEFGYEIHVVVDAFNQRVSPFERIVEIKQIKLIPKSPLGKIIKHELLNLL